MRSTFANKVRMYIGLRQLLPKCATYETNGIDDVVMCGCEHPAHSQRTVVDIYET